MAQEPHLGKLHPGPALGVALYVLLAGALAVSLLGERASFLPPAWASLAPIAFGLFLLLFAVYRFVLIRAGRYPFGRAFFQVGAGVLFLAVLLHRGPVPPAAPPDELGALIESPDPVVRRLACEVARYRPGGAAALPHVRAHLQDPVPAVRAECGRTASALSGGK